MTYSIEEIGTAWRADDDFETRREQSLPALGRRFYEAASTLLSTRADSDEGAPSAPSRFLRLDEGSFGYHCRMIDQGISSETFDRSGSGNPHVPSHVDRMEHLIETRQTALMESYLDFVTSAEYSQRQPSLNHAEKAILQTMAAHGMLLDSNNYRIANDEDPQEERLEYAREYLAKADESLLVHEHSTDHPAHAGYEIDQIERYKDEVLIEIGQAGLRGPRLEAYAALVERKKKSEEDEINDDLELAGRPPYSKPVRQPVSQFTRSDLEPAA